MVMFPLMMMAFPVAAVGIFALLALRFVRAKEQEVAQRSSLTPANETELRQLQDMVATLQAEVAQLRDRQEFVEKLLESPREPR